MEKLRWNINNLGSSMNVFGEISNKMQQRLDMSELSDEKIKESIDKISRQVMAKATGTNNSELSSVSNLSLDTSLDSFEDSPSSIYENSHDEPVFDENDNGTDDLYVDDNDNEQSSKYPDPNDEYEFPAPPEHILFPEENQSSKPALPSKPSLLSKSNKKTAKVLQSYQFDSIQVYYTLLYDPFLNPRNYASQSL